MAWLNAPITTRTAIITPRAMNELRIDVCKAITYGSMERFSSSRYVRLSKLWVTRNKDEIIEL